MSKLLIQDKFNEYDFTNSQYQTHQLINFIKPESEYNYNSDSDSDSDFNFNSKYNLSNNYTLNSKMKKTKFNQSLTEQMNIIEHIDDKNYNIYDNDVKYKIFEDISSISKNNISNTIELQLDIPCEKHVISINKIKLSNQLDKYIKDIYIYIGDKKINYNLYNEELRQNNKLEKIINNKNQNVKLHIILDSSSINKIINKNIVINYSYAIFKNKIKFL